MIKTAYGAASDSQREQDSGIQLSIIDEAEEMVRRDKEIHALEQRIVLSEISELMKDKHDISSAGDDSHT